MDGGGSSWYAQIGQQPIEQVQAWLEEASSIRRTQLLDSRKVYQPGWMANVINYLEETSYEEVERWLKRFNPGSLAIYTDLGQTEPSGEYAREDPFEPCLDYAFHMEANRHYRLNFDAARKAGYAIYILQESDTYFPEQHFEKLPPGTVHAKIVFLPHGRLDVQEPPSNRLRLRRAAGLEEVRQEATSLNQWMAEHRPVGTTSIPVILGHSVTGELPLQVLAGVEEGILLDTQGDPDALVVRLMERNAGSAVFYGGLEEFQALQLRANLVGIVLVHRWTQEARTRLALGALITQILTDRGYSAEAVTAGMEKLLRWLEAIAEAA
jgi:hypothetical protein